MEELIIGFNITKTYDKLVSGKGNRDSIYDCTRHYWANVKMHKMYGEIIYTIGKEKPNDLIKGKPPKIT
jgi:hypothetical protein